MGKDKSGQKLSNNAISMKESSARLFAPQEDSNYFNAVKEVCREKKRMIVGAYRKYQKENKPGEFFGYMILKLYKKNDEGQYKQQRLISFTMEEFKILRDEMDNILEMTEANNIEEQYEEADSGDGR